MKLLNKILIVVFILSMQGSVQATLTIHITEGVEGALPIAIVPFAWESKEKLPEDVTEVIRSDLIRSGRFAPLPEADLISRPHEGRQVNFADWRALNVDNLVIGKVEQLKDKSYRVQFQLFDVIKGSQISGYSFKTSENNLRRTAHRISDIIYEALMGIRGAFDTELAYITVRTIHGDQKIYNLAIADADGHNEKIIFKSAQPVLSPTWSPDGRHIAYVAYSRGRPELYVQNVSTRRTKRISGHQGLNNAPAWSPSGKYLAMTLSKDGNSEIYILDLAGNKLNRITNNYAIDTEPTWFPDEKGLIFTSDRGGNPQLYQIAVSGGKSKGDLKRLTYEGTYNARATISPDGKKIAMVHRVEGRFHIAVMDVNTEHFTILTESNLDESPSFAPNGSMIIFATEHEGRGVLSAVSVDGSYRQRLSFQEGDVREPAWSPFKSR
ncbi:MAG: Tol-Pal system beta propeller repeat protein TolB [Gammaproteobacteria bacterium]|nr:Tol-Pal system beta propeller repeat protein TolB [Gammaproteobacteria bacterium]MDH5650898.1 Tol-Pal system beta propeller repeat protein TolB [Gammaproteobacteria bacterium]